MATENKAVDEVQIRELIANKIKAVRAKDIDGATSNCASDVLLFDVVNAEGERWGVHGLVHSEHTTQACLIGEDSS